MNNLKKALQNLDFTDEQLSAIRKAVMEDETCAALTMKEEKTDPLIGKWVKCIEGSSVGNITAGRWYKITDIDSYAGICVDTNKSFYFLINRFDLTDPRDYEPKTVPADILEGLNLLPEDHPDFGNLRKKAIECAERFGPYEIAIVSKHKIAASLQKAFEWDKTEMKDRGWGKVFTLAESGAFDPKPTLVRVPFDYERWKKGEFEKMETRDGRDVLSIMDFDIFDWPLVGVVKGDKAVTSWKQTGQYFAPIPNPKDLFLVVKQ